MQYNLNILSTAELCQEMHTVAMTDKEKLDFRKETLSHRMENSSVNAEETAQELASAQAQLQNFNEILTALSEGDDRDELLDDIARMENEIIDLTARSQTNGFANVMNEEFNYQSVERCRTRLDAFTVLVDERTTSVST